MSRALGQNQFAGRTHAGLEQVTTLGATIGASHYNVRVHLRLSISESDVANERKKLHLLVENAGWIVLFRFPVEPTQFRVRKRADGFKAASPQPLVLRELLQHPCDLVAGLKYQGKDLRFILDLLPPHVVPPSFALSTCRK